MPSNSVSALHQDSLGFIWIGTGNGLARFDGYDFLTYRNIPGDSTSITHNSVLVIYEHAGSELWIGTEKGISIYSIQTGRFTPFQARTADGETVDTRVQGISGDENGQLWLCSYREGLFVYDTNNGTLKKIPFDEYAADTGVPVHVMCAYVDRSNGVWVSAGNTQHVVYKLDRRENRFVPAFPDLDPSLRWGLNSYAMTEDSYGNIWLGTWDQGVYVADKRGNIKAGYLNGQNGGKKLQHIHSITEYAPGKIYIGSNDGLTHIVFNPVSGKIETEHFQEPVLSNRFVYPVMKDREGGLWIGYYYGGVDYGSPDKSRFASYRHNEYTNSLNGNVVSCFCEDPGGNLWIGTDDGGLNHFDTQSQRFTVYLPDKNRNSISYSNIHALCLDGYELWIGTYTGGLNVLDTRTKQFRIYTNSNDPNSLDSNSIYALFKDSQGDIWVGTMGGINRYDREKDRFERMRKTDNTIVDIIQDGQEIWFATSGEGIYVYHLNTGSWSSHAFHANDPASLNSNDVTSFCQDETNVLWIGTSNGLCRYDAAGQFVRVELPIQHNAVQAVLAENGSLWLTTNNGLLRYAPKTGETRRFTREDGLLSDQFMAGSGIRTLSGTFYIGTANGFNSFHPRDIVLNEAVPQVSITGFQLFNERVPMQDYLVGGKQGPVLKLKHNQDVLTFEFSALSYSAPQKNQYMYMLEGFDKEWYDAGNDRKAHYTNIPAGDYIFRVKASNNDGLWNEEGIALKMVITPPFWFNGWSIALYVLLAAALIVWIFRLYRRRTEKRNTEEIARIRNEKEKEAYDSKINFFTLVAHEVRTPLSLIIGPLEQIIETSDSLPEKTVDDLNIIHRNSQRLLTLINQLLDFRKIEKDVVRITLSQQNVCEFVRGIYDRFRSYVWYKHITFVFDCDDEALTAPIDSENLTKVVSNLLNNATKFTKDYIELAVRRKTEEGVFEIRVTDNGPGVPDEKLDKLFEPFYQGDDTPQSGTGLGLYLVKSIVDAWGGNIRVENAPGKGISFCIRLPLSPETSLVAEVMAENTSFERFIDRQLEAISDKENAGNGDPDEEKPVILVVEDNREMTEFVDNSLSTHYRVLTAANGQEGLDILENNGVDLIVSDIMMPVMDGIEFMARVRKSPHWSHIPMVMLTAKTQMSSKIEALETGADAYIEKPFSTAYLSAQIRNLLDSRRYLLRKFAETPFASLKSMAGNAADAEFLARLNDIIEKNISNFDFSVDALAAELNISSSGLYAKIRNLTGATPNKLLLTVRLKKAAELLAENKYRINEICYRVGFNNPSYFSKCFYRQYGVLPRHFKPET